MKIAVRDYYEERESSTLDAIADWVCEQTNIREYPEDKPLMFYDERQDILNKHINKYLHWENPCKIGIDLC